MYFANIWWTLKLFPFRFNHRPGPLRFIEEKHYFFGEQSSVLGRASKEGLFFFFFPLPGDHRYTNNERLSIAMNTLRDPRQAFLR